MNHFFREKITRDPFQAENGRPLKLIIPLRSAINNHVIGRQAHRGADDVVR